MPLTITPVEDPGPPPIPDDAAVAAGIRRVVTFVRTSTVDFLKGERVRPPWVSEIPNQFVDPPAEGGHEDIGYAAIDNVHRQALFVLEPDGTFRMVVSARDPGTPNWLDTGGAPYGIVFWRFLLAEEPIPPIRTRVLTLD